MLTRIALLRSVNVLGKNMIKMPELVRAFEKAGFSNVRTYIQSGNILFGTEKDPARSWPGRSWSLFPKPST